MQKYLIVILMAYGKTSIFPHTILFEAGCYPVEDPKGWDNNRPLLLDI